jgi:hypothetical protein
MTHSIDSKRICLPILPNVNLAQTHNIRSYICLHFTLFVRNLHIVLALITCVTYLSLVPHIPIKCTALKKLSKIYISTVLPEGFFTRRDGCTKKEIKLFYKFIDSCVLIHVHSSRKKQSSNRKHQFL